MSSDVNYAAVLSDLRAKRAKLDTAIAAIEELGETRTSGVTLGSAATIGGPYADMTTIAAAIQHLRVAGKPMGTSQLVNALLAGGVRTTSKKFYRTLYNTLNNRVDKEISKEGRKWGLMEWKRKSE